MAKTLDEMKADLARAEAAGRLDLAERIRARMTNEVLGEKLPGPKAPEGPLTQTQRRAKAIVEKMGPIEGPVTAFGEAARHSLKQAANLIGMMSPEQVKESSEINAPLMRKHPLAAALGGMSIQVPTATAAASLIPEAVPALVAGPALGAAQGAVFSDPGERGSGALGGGTIGALFPAAAGGLKKAASGIEPTGAGKTLVEQGYKPLMTAGELRPGGFVHRLEHATANVPLAGPMTRKAYDKSLQIMEKRLTGELTPDVPAIGPLPSLAEAGGSQPWMKAAADRISGVYEDISRNAGPVNIPKSFIPRAARDAMLDTPGLTTTGQKAVSDIAAKTGLVVANKVNPTFADWQTFRSYVRERAAQWAGSESAESRAVGEALRKFDEKLTGQIESAIPTQHGAALREADRAWSQLNLVKEGLVKQAAQEGSPLANQAVIQPRPLTKALANRISDWRIALEPDRPLTRAADFQKFLAAADEALTPPMSREAARAIQAAGGGPFALAALRPRAMGVVGGLSGLYTPVGQRLLKGSTLPQRGVQALIEAAPEGTKEGLQAAALAEYLRRRSE